jgi:hypothetical protein
MDESADTRTATAVLVTPRSSPTTAAAATPTAPESDEDGVLDASAIAAWRIGRQAAFAVAVIALVLAVVAVMSGAWPLGALLVLAGPGICLGTCWLVERWLLLPSTPSLRRLLGEH